MRILGVETSCDETGVAIYDEDFGLLANQLNSQKEIHADYGGVVPELASRHHVNRIVFLIKNAILKSGVLYRDIDAVAYTAGPGLVGSLMVGAIVARSLAYAWGVPAIEVHHIEGHILTPMLDGMVLEFPFLSLVVSGGHTQLIVSYSLGKYRILGKSLDDAVGEVFDKIAELLGFDYPGAAMLSETARKGVSGRYVFPRPMVKCPSLNFSFSGLKTCVTNVILQSADDSQTRSDIARAFEEAIVETLSIKCQRALDKVRCKLLLLVGGVSANRYLRNYFKNVIENEGGVKVVVARPELCTDNAAMIAYVGMVRFRLGIFSRNLSVSVRPNWSIEDLF